MKTKNTHPNYDGVIFYSNNDLSIGYYLKKAEQSILVINSKKSPYNINEILEMYNILKLFDADVKPSFWSDSHYKELKSSIKSFNQAIGRFVASFNYSRFISIYMSVCVIYIDSFWDMFEHYKMYKKIPQSIFKELLYSDKSVLKFILLHKKIVNAFDTLISKYMIDNNRGAELFIDEYLVKHEGINKTHYFPKSLSAESKKNIISFYINSENPNPNYLDMIVKGKQCQELELDDKIRLAAKRKYNAFWSNLFEENKGIPMSTSVRFINTDEPVLLDDNIPYNPTISFSANWILKHHDYPTLMNNFIYLFGFVDSCYRSTFPVKRSKHHSIISRIGLKSKKAYPIDLSYNILEPISTLTTEAYDSELSKYSIRIEDLVKWFFESYLKTEFNVKGFYFNTSSKESTYLEKCRNLCSEFDSILKQFNAFVEDNCVDRELIEMSSSTPLFSQVKSFSSQKYGYLIDNELIKASDAFFSDQSPLIYIKTIQNNYDTFCDLLLYEKVRYDDFYDCQKNLINFLSKINLLYYDSNHILHFHKDKLFVLKDCYLNEVICLTHYKNPSYDESLKYIDSLILSKKFTIENTLFSRPEQDYLDYVLNDRRFDNGLQLRNKYIHGSNQLDVNEHTHDYYHILKLLVLTVLKMYEEFCIRDNVWNTEE